MVHHMGETEMEQTRIGRNGLYFIDNSAEDWNVKEYLRQMCAISKKMDVATGYLEIGGLLDLDQEWQKLDKIRIIMGNEVTKRTQEVINRVVDALLGRECGTAWTGSRSIMNSCLAFMQLLRQ